MVNAGFNFKHLKINPLHPTFAAQLEGVDFSKPVPKEVCNEIEDAAHQYGVLVFKKTGLDDERHIEFGKSFGDLDSTLQFIKPGERTRLAPHYELWDAGNLDADGNIIPGNTRHYEYNKALVIFMSN
jgi:alpha-ketoglutarate-dependent 2,4-dichlorophenoxyacetate dioxygenase